MDTIKKITKAVLNKNFAEAKDLLFKNLYAKASLSLDEARYSVANAVFNGVEESYMPKKKTKMKGDLVSSGGAKKMILVQKVKDGKKVGSPRPIPAMKFPKPAVKEGADSETNIDLHEIAPITPQDLAILSTIVGTFGVGSLYATGMIDRAWDKMSDVVKRKMKAFADKVKSGKSLTSSEKTEIKKQLPYSRKAVKEETEQLDEVMTRKHFQQVADVIKAHPDAKKREELAAHHSQIFKKSNPRFDEGRFRKACGIGGCKESVEVGGEQLDEVSPPGMEKMTGSPRVKASFKKQYGKRGKSVMYATAWKMHNKKKD